MAPKSTRDTWERVKLEFEAGTYSSLKGLAEKYSINPITLRTKIFRDKWTLKRELVENKIERKMEETKINLASEYLSSSFLRAKKYEKMIDASQENLGSKTQDGTPLLDPDALDTYTRSEMRIHELAKSSLRIAPISQVDITSGGKSLSMVAAIEKLRAHPEKLIDISDAQIAAISQLEVVP